MNWFYYFVCTEATKRLTQATHKPTLGCLKKLCFVLIKAEMLSDKIACSTQYTVSIQILMLCTLQQKTFATSRTTGYSSIKNVYFHLFSKQNYRNNKKITCLIVEIIYRKIYHYIRTYLKKFSLFSCSNSCTRVLYSPSCSRLP